MSCLVCGWSDRTTVDHPKKRMQSYSPTPFSTPQFISSRRLAPPASWPRIGPVHFVQRGPVPFIPPELCFSDEIVDEIGISDDDHSSLSNAGPWDIHSSIPVTQEPEEYSPNELEDSQDLLEDLLQDSQDLLEDCPQVCDSDEFEEPEVYEMQECQQCAQLQAEIVSLRNQLNFIQTVEGLDWDQMREWINDVMWKGNQVSMHVRDAGLLLDRIARALP